MIPWLLAATVLADPVPKVLKWEGNGEVYPPGETLALTIRTRIDAADNVVSESWPTAQGEAKGMHRLTLSSDGDTIEIGGVERPAPPDLAAEERKQFGFYRQLQQAALRAPQVAQAGANTFSVPGEVTSWFRIDRDGNILEAENILPGENPGTQIGQKFRFSGWWRDDGAIFPKHMEMYRGGARYFTLDVTKFDAN